MKSRRRPSNSGVKKASTDILKESSPKNKKPHKIDWAYLSYLKATGQIPVVRFTPLESPAAWSGNGDKIPFGANTWLKKPRVSPPIGRSKTF
jgi:hypothetical protein